MMAFLAIILLTIRSAFRSHFFRGAMLFFLASVFLMPLFVETDGTGAGLIKITLEYSLTLAAAILSLSAVWLGASEITADVEDLRLQMIAVKPVSRPVIYLAKYTGVLALHALLLGFAAVVIYGLTMYRIATTDMPEQERIQLDREVFTARRVYAPDSLKADLDRRAEQLLQEGLAAAKAQGKEMPDSWRTVRDKTNEFDREEILRRLQDRVRIEQAALAPGSFREWTYSGIPDDLNGPFQIRYRVYCEERQSYQSESHGVWGWEYYLPSPQNPGEMLPSMIYLVPNDKQMRIMTMQTSELEVYPKGAEKEADYFCARGFQTEGRNLKIFYAPYPGSNALMAKDGKATLRFLSLDKKGRMLYFMENDGPYLMVPVTGFADNYFRTILALFLQIMVFAAFGTAFAACFSLATGIFLTLAYLIWGLSTRFVLDVFTNTAVKPHTFLDYVNYYGGQYIDLVLLDPGAFAAQEMLSSGELVEYSYLAVLLFVEFGIKVLPFLLIGLWVYSKRELALAGKDR